MKLVTGGEGPVVIIKLIRNDAGSVRSHFERLIPAELADELAKTWHAEESERAAERARQEQEAKRRRLEERARAEMEELERKQAEKRKREAETKDWRRNARGTMLPRRRRVLRRLILWLH